MASGMPGPRDDAERNFLVMSARMIGRFGFFFFLKHIRAVGKPFARVIGPAVSSAEFWPRVGGCPPKLSPGAAVAGFGPAEVAQPA